MVELPNEWGDVDEKWSSAWCRWSLSDHAGGGDADRHGLANIVMGNLQVVQNIEAAAAAQQCGISHAGHNGDGFRRGSL